MRSCLGSCLDSGGVPIRSLVLGVQPWRSAAGLVKAGAWMGQASAVEGCRWCDARRHRSQGWASRLVTGLLEWPDSMQRSTTPGPTLHQLRLCSRSSSSSSSSTLGSITATLRCTSLQHDLSLTRQSDSQASKLPWTLTACLQMLPPVELCQQLAEKLPLLWQAEGGVWGV